MSQLLIKSKLLMIFCPSDAVQKLVARNSPDAFRNQVTLYAERYIELSSMVFDLYPFIPFLSEEDKREIVVSLEAKVITEPQRVARSRLSIAKVKKVFGFLKVEDVKGLHEEYLRALELDSKPEKGERKLADDWVIIINEILD